MARAAGSTHATIDVAGRSSTEVGRIVAAVVDKEGTYTVAPAGPDSYQLVRTYRPTWAIVAGVLGVLFLGLGILFLLVRRTELCTLTVVDGPTGAVLMISGKLAPSTLGALRQALDSANPDSLRLPAVSPSPAPSAPSVVDALPACDGVDPLVDGATGAGLTVHRGPQSTAVAHPAGYWMRLPEGEVVPLAGITLVGRDPAPLPGETPSALIPLIDPSMQVSKTHLALRVTGGALHAQDLHSTNGTVVSEPSGNRLVLTAGQSTPVTPGAVLELGGIRIEVGAGV